MKDKDFYTHEEIRELYFGKPGTPERERFDAELQSFLIGEAEKFSAASPQP